MSFQEKKAQQGVPPAVIFGFSLLVVFLMLAALYESWSLPFSVLLSTPVAVFGAFFVLWLRRTVLGCFLPPYMVQIETDVYSQIGLVMLIGLTAKNAILIVEFAKDAYEGGQPLADAALAAARLRLRPILMTSFAFVLGCVPLWTASGAGSVARQIMGTTVIGGMLAATLIAVFIIPVLFVAVERIGQRQDRDRRVSRHVSPAGARRSLRWMRETPFSAWALSWPCRSGCMVGPNYKKPAVPAPSVYRGVSRGTGRQAGCRARSVIRNGGMRFRMTLLRDLIRSALQQNYDVRIAAARILEARALLGVARADQLPAVNAAASVVNERLPEAAGRPAVETSPAQVRVSLAWELDFWGKFRRATESARASLLSEEWAQRQIISSLVSDVASAYFQLREQDLELEISRQTLASRRDSLRLTQLLADRGATSMLDVRQAEQLVFGAGASIPELERRIEQQENFISILVGKNPEGIVRGRRARRPATSTGGSSGTSVVAARTPPGHPPGGAAAGRGERTDRRCQGRLFPANLVDRRGRISKFRSHPAVRRSRRTLDRRRQRAATDLRGGKDSEPRQVCRSPRPRGDVRLSAHRPAGVSRSIRCARWLPEKPGGQAPATAADKCRGRRDQVVEHALPGRRRELPRSPG